MRKQIIIFLIFVLILFAGCQSKTVQETTTTTLPQVRVVDTGDDKANENS